MCDDSKEQHEAVRVVEFILQYGTHDDIHALTKAVNDISRGIQERARKKTPALN